MQAWLLQRDLECAGGGTAKAARTSGDTCERHMSKGSTEPGWWEPDPDRSVQGSSLSEVVVVEMVLCMIVDVQMFLSLLSYELLLAHLDVCAAHSDCSRSYALQHPQTQTSGSRRRRRAVGQTIRYAPFRGASCVMDITFELPLLPRMRNAAGRATGRAEDSPEVRGFHVHAHVVARG